MPQPSTCRACKQEIIWTSTGTGWPVALDPKPDQRRGSMVLLDGRCYSLVALSDFITQMIDSDRYTNHLATCPVLGAKEQK